MPTKLEGSDRCTSNTSPAELATGYGALKLRLFPDANPAPLIHGFDELATPLDRGWEPKMNAAARTAMLAETPDGWRVP